MDFEFSSGQREIREAVTSLCARFGDDYWRECDERNAYPEEFVRTLSEAGWLAALIPQEYGGAGLTMLDGSIILEEINHSGGNAAACHAQMYTMASLLKHGSEEQKRRYLPRIASGELRLQAFGVTEPDAGSETPRIKTFARRAGDNYVINGSKIFTSRYQHSDMLLLLTRTTAFRRGKEKDRRHEPVSGQPARIRRCDQGRAHRYHDQPRHQSALYRQSDSAARSANRRGRQRASITC